MRAGRKRTKPLEKIKEAIDYCVQYCDEQDDCVDCAFENVRIDKSTGCPMYIITALQDAIQDYMHRDEKEVEIDWKNVKL